MSKKSRAQKIRDFMNGKDFLTVSEITKGIKETKENQKFVGSFLTVAAGKGTVKLSKEHKLCSVSGRDVYAYKLAKSSVKAEIADKLLTSLKMEKIIPIWLEQPNEIIGDHDQKMNLIISILEVSNYTKIGIETALKVLGSLK